MIILTGEQFEKRFGKILYHTYISYAEKEFLTTSSGAWLFTNTHSKIFLMGYEGRNRSQARRCNCLDYLCYKCYIIEKFWKFDKNANVEVYSYMEVYKHLLKTRTFRHVTRFKQEIMEVTDEQF